MIVVCLIGFGAALISFLFLFWIWSGLYNSDIVKSSRSIYLVIMLAVVIGVCVGFFYAGTEAGKSDIKDFKSSITGMERNVRVYTADGTLLAEYEGKFNIRDENGGVMFEVDGVRYIYWNCFIESIEKRRNGGRE